MEFNIPGLLGGLKVALGFAVAYFICGAQLVPVGKAALGIIAFVTSLVWVIGIIAGHATSDSKWNRWASLASSATIIGFFMIPGLHNGHLSWFTGLWTLNGAFAGLAIVAGFAFASISFHHDSRRRRSSFMQWLPRRDNGRPAPQRGPRRNGRSPQPARVHPGVRTTPQRRATGRARRTPANIGLRIMGD